MRFTVDGSDALEARIAEDMDTVRRAVQDVAGEDDLTGLALGGGYGRGEGGVYVTEQGEQVYNDYDFFVVVPYTSRSRRRRLTEKLNAVKAAVEPGCGIHVDFGPPMPQAELPSQPYELMFMELREGYHSVLGPDDILDALPNYDTSRPPLEECARLFMNRGMGLLLARRVLEQQGALSQEDHEFVVRNIYKALMAAGDSLLFNGQNYSPSYIERRKRVGKMGADAVPGGAALLAGYEASMDFKMRPSHDVPEGKNIAEWHAEVVSLFGELFLWFEQQRLGRPDMTWEDYTALPERLPALSGQQPLKNAIRNLRTRAGGLPPISEWRLHPRDRVLKRLPGLLFDWERHKGSFPTVERLWEACG